MAEFSQSDLFARAVEAHARLLKAERLGAAGAEEREAPAFMFTFDVGRVLLSADALEGRLDALYIPNAEDVPGGLHSCDEDEPWWRLLGAPLHRFVFSEDGQTLDLQFRADDDNPRRLRCERKGASLHVRLEG